MKIVLIIITMMIYSNVYSQASWSGSFFFNLINSKGDSITSKDVINKRVKFYSFNSEREVVKYDFKNKSFVFNANTITENKSFYVICNKDTLKIKCLILGQKAIYVKKSIPIRNNIVSYSSSTIIDFIINNKSDIKINHNEIYYLNDNVSIAKFDIIEQNHIKKHIKKFKLIEFVDE